MPARVYAKNQTRFDLTRPEGVAQPLSTFLAAMQHNLATSGYVIAWVPSEHGYNRAATKYSEPGCFIASPSYDAEQKAVHGAPLNQDYVYNWTRDAALAAIELSFDEPPPGATESQRMIDYVAFARLCQEVSRRRESHPPPLAEPSVKVALHTAPTVEPVGIAPCRQ